MTKSSGSAQSTTIQIEPSEVELQPVNKKNAVERSTDVTDDGCAKACCPKESEKSKENVSLSLSSDDETEQDITLNMNKKSNNIAYKGMMDIALLTANANQLRFLITYNSEQKTFIISATLIVLSLFIQVAVGIGLIYKRYMKRNGNRNKAEKASSLIICGIFCLAVINVLVVSFTTTTTVISPT